MSEEIEASGSLATGGIVEEISPQEEIRLLRGKVSEYAKSIQNLELDLVRYSNLVNEQAKRIVEVERKERGLAFELYNKEQQLLALKKDLTNKLMMLEKQYSAVVAEREKLSANFKQLSVPENGDGSKISFWAGIRKSFGLAMVVPFFSLFKG